MRLIDKFEKFLDNSAKQVGGYKILVVIALFLGYFWGQYSPSFRNKLSIHKMGFSVYYSLYYCINEFLLHPLLN